MMVQGAEAGVFEQEEQHLIANVFRLDRQKIGAIMTPRMDVVYLDVEDSPTIFNARSWTALIPSCRYAEGGSLTPWA